LHPSFLHVFAHPERAKPLSFTGSFEEGRWSNGFLCAEGEDQMYPVINGIPIFIPPWRQEQVWPKWALSRMRKENWIAQNWKKAREQLDERPKLREFATRLAKSDGSILDVASGPGGGFVPMVLQLNAKAEALMCDLSLGLLQEWRTFLVDRGTPNVSFAVFDATKMPLKSDSIDAVSDLGGFDNIVGSMQAIEQAYRVLKPGGTLFSFNGVLERDGFLKLPEKVRASWYSTIPLAFDGYLQAFKQVGFKEIGNTVEAERELSPDEGGLPGEAAKYGVRLRVRQYCTEAIK
jgi:ubiquinone/menaquinone biosynthesis C-methylase UbiE/uncharacterized protein YbaR (Trm112 family)